MSSCEVFLSVFLLRHDTSAADITASAEGDRTLHCTFRMSQEQTSRYDSTGHQVRTVNNQIRQFCAKFSMHVSWSKAAS